jgi:hypothetical protein
MNFQSHLIDIYFFYNGGFKMRTVRGYEPGKSRKYIPEFDGNRSCEKPVTVWIRTPTERDRREIYASNKDVIVETVNGKQIVTTKGVSEVNRQALAIERFVEIVENYKVQNGPDIVDGKTLAEHGESQIVFEVAAEILLSCSLTEDESKKSEELPSISQAVTQAKNGTVKNVKVMDYDLQEIAKGKTATLSM